MMRSFVLAAIVAAALCGPGAAQGLLPAPVADNVTHVVAIEQSGGSVTAAVGERIAVTLMGKPSTGAAWVLAEKPVTLSDSDRTFGPTVAPSASGRPVLGASRWEVFTFEVIGAGEGALRLEQRTRQDVEIQTFEITVVSQ